MGTEPEQIRQEIERTRADLGSDLDLLTEKVSPSAIVQRRTARTKDAVGNLRDSVMGSAKDTSSSVGDRTGSALSSAQSSVQQAPTALKQRAEGNPLAAGLIAFGVGWLASSLIPVSETEKRVGAQAKQAVQDNAGPVKEQLSQVAHEVTDQLREPAAQAVEEVKSSATQAKDAVKDQADAAQQQVKDTAQEQATRTKEEVRPSSEGQF